MFTYSLIVYQTDWKICNDFCCC